MIMIDSCGTVHFRRLIINIRSHKVIIVYFLTRKSESHLYDLFQIFCRIIFIITYFFHSINRLVNNSLCISISPGMLCTLKFWGGSNHVALIYSLLCNDTLFSAYEGGGWSSQAARDWGAGQAPGGDHTGTGEDPTEEGQTQVETGAGGQEGPGWLSAGYTY